VAAHTGVLFVCTGNICRSPTAEGVFRHMAEEAHVSDRYLIDSAGTHAYHEGEPPDTRTLAAARRRGYDLSRLRARLLAPSDFTRFDWLIALDEGHQRILLQSVRKARRPRVRLLLEFGPQGAGRSVPDPYGGGDEGFERVLNLIEEAARGLLAFLEAGAGPRAG
jgi:protein-tyrosine phosphatase